MVRPELMKMSPKPPRVEDIDPEALWVSYDELTDALHIQFFGPDRPAVSVPVDEHVYLRVDVHTHEIVGMILEEFLEILVLESPELLDHVERLSVVPSGMVELARSRITPEAEKREFVRSVVKQFASLPA